jgi:hypothetical protein
MPEHTDRRTFLTGIGAVSVSVGLAGCGGLLGGGGGGGGNADLAYGDTVEGSITNDGPRDPKYDDLCATHSFEGSGGDTVEIRMTSEEVDPYLILTGPGGDDVVAEDDDGASGLNSEMVVDLPSDGVYTIWAGSFSGDATGSYTLSLSQA